MEILIGVGVVVAYGVIFFFVKRFTNRITRGAAALVASQKPTRTLAEALLVEGEAVALRATSVAGYIALWLDHDVVTDPTGSWSGEVMLRWRAGPREGSERFTFGADTEGHFTAPSATGVLWFPAGQQGGRDQGILKLAVLSSSPSEPLEAHCTLLRTPSTKPAVLRVFIGLA
jgi:hypothetical protein